MDPGLIGAPGEIRTPDRLVCSRSLNQAKKAGRVLYPEHAQTHIVPGAKGRIVEHKQNILPASHKALPHTYAATAKALGVPPLFLKLLMNHKITDVTDGYAAGTSLLGALIADQERISEALASRT